MLRRYLVILRSALWAYLLFLLQVGYNHVGEREGTQSACKKTGCLSNSKYAKLSPLNKHCCSGI